MKYWYAVASDSYEAWDYGSYNLREAKKMLRVELRDDPKNEDHWKIVKVNEKNNFCEGEYTFKHGWKL